MISKRICRAALICAGLAAVAPGAIAGATAGSSIRGAVPGPGAARCVPLNEARFAEESSCVERILELADLRLSLMPAVAAWKWQHQAPVSDPPRERAVVLAAGKLASSFGLAPAPVEQLFALQVRLARAEESRLTSRWLRSGYDFSGPVPDLHEELRPQLDRITRELLEALYLSAHLSAPALAHADISARYARRAAGLLHSEGWTDASRAELLADLGRIRPRAAPALERIEASHLLRIGTTGDYAPFSAESRGELQGVDIELASDLARKLGAHPVFVRTSWAMLLEDLRSDRFDVAIGGISATPERAAAAAMSIPYLSGGKTIIARCRDANRFTSLSAVDRPQVRVVVNPGGTNEEYVRTHLHRARVIVAPSNTTVFDRLIAGGADVMITDDAEVELEVHRHPQLCRALAGTLTRAAKVLLTAPDPGLTAAVNEWLRGALAAQAPARLLREALSSSGTLSLRKSE
jgi:cyclohexadienyl dehydratase